MLSSLPRPDTFIFLHTTIESRCIYIIYKTPLFFNSSLGNFIENRRCFLWKEETKM